MNGGIPFKVIIASGGRGQEWCRTHASIALQRWHNRDNLHQQPIASTTERNALALNSSTPGWFEWNFM